MTGKTWTIGLFLVAAAALLLPSVAEATWTAPCEQCPCQGQACIPNTGQHGHFQKIWRPWPGTPSLDRTFPRAIGREEVPTPEGQKQEPLPRVRVPKTTPGEFPGGGILPPETGFGTGVLPDFGTGQIPSLPTQQDDTGILGLPPGTEPLLPPEKGVIEEPPGFDPPSAVPPAQVEPAEEKPAEDPLLETPDEPPFGSSSEAELLPPANFQTEEVIKPVIEQPIVTEADLDVREVTAEEPAADITSPDIEMETISSEAADAKTEVLSEQAADLEFGDDLQVAGSEVTEEEIFEAESPADDTFVIRANWDSALGPASSVRRGGPAMLPSAASIDMAIIISEQEVVQAENEAVQTVAGFEELAEEDVQPTEASVQQKEVAAEQTANELGGAARLADRLERFARSMPTELDGYCPVTLIKSESWAAGKEDFKVVHEGKVYLLGGEKQMDAFLANPSLYAPAFSGKDVVQAKESGQRVSGKIDYCVTYAGRLYMFSNGDSLLKFQEAPEKYATAAQE